jgi:hypothetical protein
VAANDDGESGVSSYLGLYVLLVSFLVVGVILTVVDLIFGIADEQDETSTDTTQKSIVSICLGGAHELYHNTIWCFFEFLA